MRASTITLNGQEHPLEDCRTIYDLLCSLHMQEKPVVVELNQQAILPSEFASAELLPGARVEIISIVAGG